MNSSPLSSPISAPRAASDFGFRSLLWVVLALAVQAILLLGYKFGEVNHNEQLPMILRAIDPNYLRSDWIVGANDGFNHRWFYSQLMALLSRVFGVEGAFYAVYLGAMALWTTGLFALMRDSWRGDQNGDQNDGQTRQIIGAGAVFAPLLLLFNDWGTISNSVGFGSLVPALLAFALMIWFAVALRRGWWIGAGVLLFAAGLLHAQIGPLSGIFILFAHFYALRGAPNEQSQPNARDFRRFWPLWILGIAVPLGLALISDDKRPLSPAQEREALEILAYVRHPWHYVPTSWTRTQWLGEFAWLGVLFVARAATRPSRFLDGMLLAVAAFCLSGFLPFLIDKLFPLVKLQHFRMTIWFQIIGSLYLARYLAQLWCDQSAVRRVAGAVLLGAMLWQIPTIMGEKYRVLLPLSLFGFWWFEKRARDSQKLSWATLLWLLPWTPLWFALKPARGIATDGIIATVSVLGLLWLWQNRRGVAVRAAQGALVLGALVLLSAWRPLDPLSARFAKRVKPHLINSGPDAPMQAWARQNTPRDAIFIIPPDLQTFRLKAERAVVADFKVFPWSDAGLLDWRARITDLCGGQKLPLGYNQKSELKTAYASLNAAQVAALSRRYKARYFLAPQGAKGDFSGFKPLYADSQWRIYDLRS